MEEVLLQAMCDPRLSWMDSLMAAATQSDPLHGYLATWVK